MYGLTCNCVGWWSALNQRLYERHVEIKGTSLNHFSINRRFFTLFTTKQLLFNAFVMYERNLCVTLAMWMSKKNRCGQLTCHSNVLFMKVHFDDVSLYGTPKEEPLPNLPSSSEKPSSNFLKNQLQQWFQPTDNRLAMKLFGSKKALVKERIRQKTAGHWVIHPCSSFRWVSIIIYMVDVVREFDNNLLQISILHFIILRKNLFKYFQTIK